MLSSERREEDRKRSQGSTRYREQHNSSNQCKDAFWSEPELYTRKNYCEAGGQPGAGHDRAAGVRPVGAEIKSRGTLGITSQHKWKEAITISGAVDTSKQEKEQGIQGINRKPGNTVKKVREED